MSAPIGSNKDAPILAASRELKERESTGDKPNRAAPRTVPNPTEIAKPLHREASSVAARLTASVEPKEATPDDATVMSASEGTDHDHLSSSKRRRLKKVRRAAERQELLTAAQGPLVNPKPAPGAIKATGSGAKHFADGVLKMWCEEAYALRWLTGTCDAITNPIPDTREPNETDFEAEPPLKHQVVDPDARTENKGPDRRLSLFFRVPESEIVTIKKQDRRIYYLLGNIYIRILDKDEPSQVVDAPPEAIASTSGTVTPRPMPSTRPGGVNTATAVCAPPLRRTDLIQANLQHSQTASASLRRLLETNPKTIAAIQEPWIRNGKMCGLGNTGGKILLDTRVSNPRTCILIPRHVPALLINELCSRDLTVVRLPRNELPDIVLASAYLPGDEDVPTPELGLLADYCEREKLELIIAADSNAHHTLWGNANTNARGENMLNFILSNNLILANSGSEPTFINARSQTIIDLTLITVGLSDQIHDWHVSSELSCSDHRWIRFAIKGDLPKPQPRRIPRRTDSAKFHKLVSSEIVKLTLPTIIDAQDIDKHANNLTSLLLTSYEQSCPLTVPRWGGKQNWWCPELERNRRKVRKLFNRAGNTMMPRDWDKYTVARRRFKKLLRTRKQECWRHFCTSIENNNLANRVKSCLSRETYRSVGCLKKPDNTYTKTDAETCELLLATHFPGCTIANEQSWQKYAERVTVNSDWQVADKIVTREKVTWAINSFLPFKAAGIDGIFPGLLRWGGSLIVDYLVPLFRACIAHRYIPLKWREVKIIFIPKPGREDYTQAKSFRPISLTSFLLKTLERLGDLEIRSRVSLAKFLHPNQHAYSSGKSTESSLHNVVSRIGNSLKIKQSTLGAFIDIEGAFDETNFTSITNALVTCGVPSTLTEWINNMLKQRAIQFTVNPPSLFRHFFSGQGCPQGGVLSPLLWNLVVNELITELNAINLYTVGYADDIAILASGNFESTLCDEKGFQSN
ncbi:unnamed protein product [Pieris macdunnoughi]|uniref:Reverse transcriptase domain-containing protein n=1 Tax=Pieris macdunnoughi TaxID=345717 RepID=A0A821X492_9NEOP|nr:unnamed protein product [Pieris macdunnoughi]